MSDSEATTSTKKRRTFREKAPIEENDNLKPSPPSSPEQLPSRLDCIPSPSYGRDSVSPEQTKDKGDENDKKSDTNKEEINNSEVEDVKEKRRRSSSRSPRRKRSKSPSRRKRSRSRDRDRHRCKSRSRSRDRRRRSRSRERKRSKSRDRRRSRSRDRKRSRSRDRKSRRRSHRSRSRERSRRSRSRSRDRRRSKSPKRKTKTKSPSPPSRYAQPGGVCRAVVSDDFKTKEVTTQEVEERLKLHMQKIQEQAAEEAKKINMPGYLNPAMVNVQQFKQIQDKRKLLWSKPKDKKEGAAMWSGAFEDQNNDEKFKRLMGIQGVKVDETKVSKVQESRKVLDNLEKQYETSRAFQMSRGAGGLTGMGLGFGSMAPQPPQ